MLGESDRPGGASAAREDCVSACFRSADGPLVSVMVPAWNAAATIGECLDSLLSQTYTNFEVVVVDDCSDDDTVRVVEERALGDQRIRLFRNDPQLREAGTRNRCLAESSGEYVMLQDADDVCEPVRIATLVDHLETHDAAFVSSGFYLFDDGGTHQTVQLSNESPGKMAFLWGSPFCHAATMFRRVALTAVGGYRVSQETRRGADYDLFMRLYAAGLRGSNLAQVLYGYRVDSSTIARRTLEYRIDECRIRIKGFTALGLMPLGAPFVLKPLFAHLVQRVRFGRL